MKKKGKRTKGMIKRIRSAESSESQRAGVILARWDCRLRGGDETTQLSKHLATTP